MNNNQKLIKEELLSGKRISVLSVLKTVQTIEARHYIAALRREGMDIKDEWVTAPGGKHYKEYWLEAA